MSTAGQGSVQAVDAREAAMDEADLTELTKDAFQKIAEYLNGELEGIGISISQSVHSHKPSCLCTIIWLICGPVYITI